MTIFQLMKNGISFSSIFFAFCIALIACTQSFRHGSGSSADTFYPSSKPCTRWWWFATEIKKEDIRHQLDWMKKMNFGGVEIAWVYPLYRYQKMYAEKYNRHYPVDTSAQECVSDEWSDVVHYAKSYADSIGMACDFTFGSAWPVAGSNIERPHRTQIYGDSAFQQVLTFAWTYPDTQWVINHLDSIAFNVFAKPVAEALRPALKGKKSALFTDSWEIKLNAKHKIWTPGFEKSFYNDFRYDIIPYMNAGIDSFPDVRYDYMLHLEKYVTDGFYRPFVRKCRSLGAWSRVQCLSAPADVMTLYSLVDIPESEAMLNNPNFSRIVSSSACLSSKKLVTSETFTCMYGFPATYLRQEQTADLKMVADALFAHGINQHFYHGTPYNPVGSDTIEFFATTYFGPGGSLEPELPAFNAYIEKVSGLMQKGKTYSDVAVYVPYEDGVMKGAYPPEKQRVWVWGEYELRYIDPPKETEGYHPLWINRHFLKKAVYQNGKLLVGDARFSMLYIDVEFMDVRSLRDVLKFAKKGLPVCMKREPREPGKIKSADYHSMIGELKSLKNVSTDFKETTLNSPLIAGDTIPEYWCRVDNNGDHYIFLAQQHSTELKYPVYSGQSLMKQSDFRELSITVNGHTIKQLFEFQPYQSLMLRITPSGKLEFIDIAFTPNDPVVRAREPQKMYF